MAAGKKHALITGGSRGIGRGIALKLAERGVKVAIHYLQNESGRERDTGAGPDPRRPTASLVQADVSQPGEISAHVPSVSDEFGKLDIFVSNARPEVPEFFQAPLEITLEQWDTAFDSQAKAFLVGAREAAPLMGDGGRIIAVTYAEGSRTGGLQPWVGMGSAKAALESLVRYFAVAAGQARDHRERDQPGLDRGQRPEHAAPQGAGPHPERGTSAAGRRWDAWARPRTSAT